MADLCSLSDLPVDQCGCRIHAPEADKGSQVRPVQAFTPGPVFEARYPGRCVECDERIHEGDWIRVTPDGPIHNDCEVSS